MPWYLASSLLAFGLIVCTIITLAPLGRRKRLERAAQLAGAGDVALAYLDPLDAAAADSLNAGPLPESTARTTSSTRDRPE